MSAILSKPEAIFFDWDGTLVDSFSFLEMAHDHVLSALSMPSYEQEGWFKPFFGKPRDMIYPAIYGDKEPQARRVFEQFVVQNHKTLLSPMSGALALIKAVNDMGIPAGVVSNKKADLVNAEINHLNVEQHFLCTVGAGEACEDKPSPAPLFLGVERAGINVDIANVWYVGDTIMDLKCANNAGSKSVLITNNEEASAALLAQNPSIILKNCKELADLVLQYRHN